jgi:antirestriction protein
MSETQPANTNGEAASERRPEAASRVRPKIYVASLSDYNAGRMHGVWLEADTDNDNLLEGVKGMLAASPEPIAEEYAIHDYESFGPLRLSEFESLETVSRLGRGIGEHGLAFAHWADLVGTGSLEALDQFEDAYWGHYNDLEEYGESIIEAFGLDRELEEVVPDLLASYVHIDNAAFARDLEASGQITTSAGDGGIYVFEGTV